MKKRNQFKFKKGFTLIEISIVVLIIGIMIAGTFIGTRLVAKSRLAAAESLARSSPVPGIKDNMLWLETSLSGSIDSSQANDGKEVKAWYDQSSNSNKPVVVAMGAGPTYANTINYVHAIKFAGSTEDYLQVVDASFLNNTDYTIMVLEKRQSNSSNNYFIGENQTGTTNQNLALGYIADSSVIHSQGAGNSTTATVSSYTNSTDKARQFTFVHSSVNGNSTYINGILAAQDATKTAHLTSITSLAIGKGYTGEIGEIAIFTRALKSEERQSVEDYASKKWSRSNNRNAVSNGSCLGYTITETGCDLSASTCSISVAGLVATVSPTSTSISIPCNQDNYSGSVNYTCVNGTANVTGSCTATASCTLGLAGSSNTNTVAHGASGNITCDSAGYSGGTVSYTCNNGTASYGGSCVCATGYVNPNCASCDTNYNMTNGVCVSTNCTGGTIDTTTVPGSVIHKFTANGTFTCTSAKTVQVLLIAGGGGGGNRHAGGGGGGGFLETTASITANTNYSVVVGAGGLGSTTGSATGSSGANSTFAGLTAIGGGAGGGNNKVGLAGGSGGGGSNGSFGGAGTSGQGNRGGNQNNGNGCCYANGAGGGGAGSAGANTTGGASSGGGIGKESTITGTSVYYSGGGGGGIGTGSVTYAGGNGGGASGGSKTVVASSAVANTGGGGGGGGANGGISENGGNGGSGIVIIRY